MQKTDQCTKLAVQQSISSPKKPQTNKQVNKALLPKGQRIHERPCSFHITVAMEPS